MNCPECGKEISDKAKSCPTCGFPIEDSKESIKEIDEYEKCSNARNGIQLEYSLGDNLQKRGVIDVLLDGMRWVLAILVLILSIAVLTRGVSEFKLLQFLILLSISYLISPMSNKLDIYHKQNTLTKVIVCIILFFSSSFLTNIDTKNTKTSSANHQETAEIPTVTEQEIKEKVGDDIVDTKSINTLFSLTAGTYIIGEDIDTGKYNFYAQSGNGSLKVYNSYEDYKNDEYGYDAFQEFDVLAEGASRGLLNKDVCTDKVMNIRLSDDQCLIIDKGLNLQYEFSEKITDSILPVGVYVISEDLDAGKYNFTAIKGTGSIKIYNSYEEYQQDEYGYDAFVDYDMREESASTGLLNEDVYSQLISNIRLEDNQCLVIDGGLAVEYTLP